MNDHQANTLNASLQHVVSQLEGVKEIQARLQSLEQVVAGSEARGHGFAVAPGIGASVLEQLGESGDFRTAAEVAARGGKLPAFAARVNLSSSIRAALVGEDFASSSDGTMPRSPERRGTVGAVAAPTRLLDVLPSRPTTSDSVEHVRLSSTGSVGEQVQQGDVKAELSFEGTLVRAEIATVAAWMAASKQVLSDGPALQALIASVIGSKIRARLENQLLNGTGSPGHILGLIPMATAFSPTIAATPADTIGEALVAMATDGYSPTAVVLNPIDWFSIQTTKSLTEGLYLLGSPALPIPPALWNAPVVASAAMPAGSFLTLDTAFMTVLDREQLSVTVSNSHADFFTRNLVAILAELRAGLEVLDSRAVRIGSLYASS